MPFAFQVKLRNFLDMIVPVGYMLPMEPGIPRFSFVATGCVFALLGIAFAAAGAVNVTEYHNHDSRDGLYVDPSFTRSGAAALTRDLTFSGSITGNVYAQPLFIEGGPGGKAMVIAVTEANNVYALDATNGAILWQMNVGPPVPSGTLDCGNITPSGITGTPIVDLPSRALFFSAMMMVTNPVATNTLIPEHFIFSLDVDTGSVNPGWPINVDTNVMNGTTAFPPLTQGQRGALAIVGANLYVPFGGLAGDCLPYYGWVVGMPLNNPTNLMAWATSAQGGALWSVNGISSDGASLFVATGNTFNTSGVWGGGEAVIHLLPSLVLTNGTTNYWAPNNWQSLDNGDLDLGSSGALLVDVPGATPSALVAAFGKDGNVYLLNRTNLGGIGLPVAQAHVSGNSIIQASATYQTSKGTYVAYGSVGNLCALLIGATNPPTISNAWCAGVGSGDRCSPFVTSTDGTHNVIVWGIGGDGRLHAFDGDTGTNIFGGGGANELMSGTRSFETAIVARGRIYVANDNQVYAFEVPPLPVEPIRLTSVALLPGGAFQFAFTNTPGLGFSVFGTTNVALPFTNWTPLGSATEISAGQFQFVDPQAASNSERFYRVRSP